jgi:hypothetical protein
MLVTFVSQNKFILKIDLMIYLMILIMYNILLYIFWNLSTFDFPESENDN